MIIQQAIEVLKIESNAVKDLIKNIDDNFIHLVDKICNLKGRVIIGGIGKSGLIGKKIVATLNSTGTNSVFLHPVEAMHGDLGIVNKDDIFLAMSNSGETSELNILLPKISSLGCSIVAFTGNTQSTLAHSSEIVINVGVKEEACPMGIVPTSSTTALLAMGDALAVALMSKKKFKIKDFKRSHPGGSLGQLLSNKVQEVMLVDDNIPVVTEGTTMEKTLLEIDRLQLGGTFIVNENKKLSGILTDGDIRHSLANNRFDISQPVETMMTKKPKSIRPDSLVSDVLNTMEKFQITILPVVNIKNEIIGIIHLHDILGKGDFKFGNNGNNN